MARWSLCTPRFTVHRGVPGRWPVPRPHVHADVGSGADEVAPLEVGCWTPPWQQLRCTSKRLPGYCGPVHHQAAVAVMTAGFRGWERIRHCL